jgi:hypothetical protein
VPGQRALIEKLHLEGEHQYEADQRAAAERVAARRAK